MQCPLLLVSLGGQGIKAHTIKQSRKSHFHAISVYPSRSTMPLIIIQPLRSQQFKELLLRLCLRKAPLRLYSNQLPLIRMLLPMP
jgi:hypothetical protein